MDARKGKQYDCSSKRRARTDRTSGPVSGILVVVRDFGPVVSHDARAEWPVRDDDAERGVIKVEPPNHGDDTRTFGPFYKGQHMHVVLGENRLRTSRLVDAQ
jgi:hypothetical protein